MFVRFHLVLLVALVGVLSAGAWDETAATRRDRERMVETQIAARGVRDARVLDAMRSVPRHLFVPEELRRQAYQDHPLPIGEGQTISQPYIVALMTELLEPQPDDTVLEVGTGSGYQAAVLSPLVREVYTIEIKPLLHERSRELLERLGYDNVRAREGDGYFGWEEAAPFDGIMITAAVDHIPPPLLAQLAEDGVMVLPLGNPFGYQNLVVVRKRGRDYEVRQVTGVLFVPMTGQAMSR
ncbi:MAG: protein-L-isoaspartate(D-aspartate) O-methyltransferase [Spirochaetales bacterium]|nr:protein-L-isoaspartate(D-aspartate) O-methyltransferase [Spirochaetales bacterium]